MALIGEVHVLLNAVDSAVKGGAAPPASPVPNKVKAEAGRMPEPVRSMMDTLSQGSAQVAQLMVRQNLGQEVRSQVGEFCQQAVAGRYPLDRGSSRDATPADFAQVFGPGGKIDLLFQQKLAPYVDTAARPWKFRAVEGRPAGRGQRHAAAVPARPGHPRDLLPLGRHGLAEAAVQAGGDGRDPEAVHPGRRWPGRAVRPRPAGADDRCNGRGRAARLQVRVQVQPARLGQHLRRGVRRPVGAAAPVRQGQDRTHQRAREIPRDLRRRRPQGGVRGHANSVRNPFRMRELNEFACPAGL
jgi:type VI secretion system protein ImpL